MKIWKGIAKIGVVLFLSFLCCWNAVSANGVVEVRPFLTTPINDAVGLRYNFYVVGNTSNILKIIFGSTRVYGTGGTDTYNMENNIYSERLTYTHPVCTTWPMIGTRTPAESSVRICGREEYFKNKGKFGFKTFNTTFLPKQSYYIDGISSLQKTDAITQANMNGQSGSIQITRGAIVTDKTGWKCNGAILDSDTYRQWNIQLNIGLNYYNIAIAFPNKCAMYMYPTEILALYSEFLNSAGTFKIYFWNFEILRNNQTVWTKLNRWKVMKYYYPGYGFGVKVVPHNGMNAIEFSNGGTNYLPTGFVFSL